MSWAIFFKALGYIVSVFNHWIFALCRFAFNVNGLCKTELACSGQDSQGLGFKIPSTLWVHVVMHLDLLLFLFSYCHFMLRFSMLHYGNFHQNINLKVTFLFQP
jgi:hypothetical protein